MFLVDKSGKRQRKGTSPKNAEICPIVPGNCAIPCMAAGAMIQERVLRAEVRTLRRKSTLLAMAIFAADLLIYVALTWAAIAYRSWMLGTLAGAAIGMLFIVGHDACHGSFTASRRLNQWIGRIAFMPSFTPFRAWELGHNHTHHVYTNLK